MKIERGFCWYDNTCYICPQCQKNTRILYFINPEGAGMDTWDLQICHVCLYNLMKGRKWIKE